MQEFGARVAIFVLGLLVGAFIRAFRMAFYNAKEGTPSASHNTQSAAIAQIAARLDHRVRTDRQMSSEEAWQDVVTEAVRQLRAL